jgi:hypothetical protein
MTQDSDLEQLRQTLGRAMSGIGDRRPQRPAEPEPRTEPLTFDQRVAAAVQNAPEYVDAIRSARDSLGAASRSMAPIDLLDDSVTLDRSNELRSMLADRGPEANQRLAATVRDWDGRLERGQQHLAEVVTRLDAAATALETASEQRLAAGTPGMLPSTSAPEHDLDTMRNGVGTAQQRAAFLGERLEGDRATLKYDVLDKADNPPSDWRNNIRDVAPSIRWTDNVRGDVAGQLETVSSQVEGLASELGEYSPEPLAPESTQSSEQNLRLRTIGKAAVRGGEQAGK